MIGIQRYMIVLAILLLASVSAQASEISIDDAWVREGPPNARVLGGYMKMHNTGDHDDALVTVSSRDFDKVEMHRMLMKDGMSMMEPQEKVMVPAGGEVVFEPGGYHLMLIRPKRALKAGDSITIDMGFASGQHVAQPFTVRKGAPE